MRVKVSKSKYSESYFVIKDVLDVNGKRTTKVVEKLGNKETIEQEHPEVDALTWAKQRAAQLTQQEKDQQETVITHFDASKLISAQQRQSFNAGYLFLQSIYHELGLHEITKSIQERSRIKYDLDQILSRLLYLRILNPGSKLNNYVQADSLLEPVEFDQHHIYRALALLSKESDFIESEVYQRSLAVIPRNTKILYYDCTNFFFEIEEEEGVKRYGKSKENRPNPIVQMGLFLDGSGLPLAFTLTPGNQNEQTTLQPLEKRILKDFGLSKFVVCTDAGLSSNANRKFNNVKGREYITTQSIKKLKKHLKEWALSPVGWTDLKGNKNIDLTKVPMTMPDGKVNPQTYYKERWINENELEERLVVSFSPKYKLYQESIREGQIERALKKIDRPSTLKKKNAHDPARFIKVVTVTKEGEIAQDTQLTLDEEVIQKEAQYDGFYAVCTSLESSSEELVQVNKQRWEIEETFRIMKTEFKSRPVYLQRDDRIQAHFLTCFLSLLLFRILEKRLKEKFTCSEIVQTLREMTMMPLHGEGYIPTFTRTKLTDALHETFGFRTDTQIVLQKKMKKIFKQTKSKKSTQF